MANGDMTLKERLDRIESKIDLIVNDLHSKSLDINTLKVKVAIFSSIFGTIAGALTALIKG